MKVKAFILLVVVSIFLLGASNFETFNECIKQGDLKCAKKIIDNWGTNKENDPQYYICLFNYYVHKSRTEGLAIQQKPPEGETIEITDPKTGEVKGYFAPSVHYDEEEAQKGIDYLKVGIKKFPDHYEMRFGLLYMYKEVYQLDNYLEELKNALSYLTKVKPSKIYWNNNESITNPNNFVLETVQGNFFDIMNDKNISANTNFMHTYCDHMIKYFPQHKYGYSDKGIIYYVSNDLKNALDYFLKAFSLDKQDELIAFNLGFTYKKMGDKVNAIKYFKKVLELSNDEYYVEGAKQTVRRIKKRIGPNLYP